MPALTEEIKTVLAITLLLLLITSFVIFFLLFYRHRFEKYKKEKKELQHTFNQTLLQSQLEIQEETFKKISLEIHDNIAQALSLAKLNLNTMTIEQPEQLEQKIILSKNLVSKAIIDLRDLSRSLNTDYVVEMGLIKSIEYELEMIKKTAPYQVNFKIQGQVYRFDKKQELIIFRIVQETLNNIVKHAGATKIDTSINYLSDKLELSVSDNGKGFTNEDSGKFNGLGLRNMQGRAQLIGAFLQIESSVSGSGTTITLVLPKRENGHEPNLSN